MRDRSSARRRNACKPAGEASTAERAAGAALRSGVGAVCAAGTNATQANTSRIEMRKNMGASTLSASRRYDLSRTSRAAAAASTSASSPGRPAIWTDAGSPSSAGPHGSARAGAPRTLNGQVRSVSQPRCSRSSPKGGATRGSVGVDDEVGATEPLVEGGAVASLAWRPAWYSESLTSRQRSIFDATSRRRGRRSRHRARGACRRPRA